jgi:hypothetical protein
VPHVREEFQPTLPALVRRRFGLPERTTIVLLLIALALLAIAVVLVRPRVDTISNLVHREDPRFTMEYANTALASEAPEGDELARLEGRRGRQSATVTVRPLDLPAASGDVAHGLLPVYASGHIRELAREIDGFRLTAQHRARINDAPGYEMRFQTGGADRRMLGIDLVLLPEEETTQGALLLSLRRNVEGPVQLTKAERRFAERVSEAFRSLRYGVVAE